MVDAQGSVVADHLPGRNPLTIEWSGVVQADGRYFLIVAADNQSLPVPPMPTSRQTTKAHRQSSPARSPVAG